MTNVRILTAIYVSPNQTITSGGLLTLAHGLPAAPNRVWLGLVCVVANNGWNVGDEFFVPFFQSGTGTKVTSVYRDSANVYVRYSSATSAFSAAGKTNGAPFDVTNSQWNLRVYAE